MAKQVADPPPAKQGWKKVSTYKGPDGEKVSLWFDVWASPLSMGMADAWDAENCWRESGEWFDAGGRLETRYITHWRPLTAIAADVS